MKKLNKMFVILSVLLFTTNIFAQTASVTWALNSTTQLTSANVGNVTGSAESISSGSGQFGMSVFDYTSNGQRLWEGTAGWIAGTEEATRYIQFNALPANGNNLTVTNVSFNYGAAGIDHNIQSNAYYSTDGWVTRTLLNPGPLEYSGSAIAPFTKNISVTIASGTTFSVRIYPYAIVNSSPMRPTFAVHSNLVISGTTAAKKNCLIEITNAAGKWGKQILIGGTLQVLGTPSNSNLPNKVLQFYVDDIIVGKATADANGIASIAYTIQQDSVLNSMKVPQDSVAHTIKAEFAGDADYNAQSSTGKLTVVRHVTNLAVAPTIFIRGAQPVIVQATLTDNDESGKGVSSKELKFYKISPGTREGDTAGVYIGSGTTNANGVASLSSVWDDSDIVHTILVLFAGDANYSPKSSTGIFTNTLKNSILQITNVAGKWGKSVVLKAYFFEPGLVHNIDLPNQELKFYKISPGTREGDTVRVYIGSGKTDANGVVSIAYTIPQDSVSSSMKVPQDSVAHSIKAEFAGDANYSVQIGTGTLTVVRHVANIIVATATAVYGQPVVFTASLTDNDNDGKGVSNRVLEFTITVVALSDPPTKIKIGSATTNSSGVASISYTLPQDSVASTHTITAVYTGDTNYSAQSSTGKLTMTLVGVEKNQADIPTKFDLSQNYPNPFNPTSTIRYDIPKAGFVNISVYDVLGREVKVLVSEQKSAGHYEILFDAATLSSGIYFYTIRSAEFTQSKKMILMK